MDTLFIEYVYGVFLLDMEFFYQTDLMVKQILFLLIFLCSSYVRLFSEHMSTLAALDAEYTTGIPDLYSNQPRQFHISVPCHKKSICAGPATIVFRVRRERSRRREGGEKKERGREGGRNVEKERQKNREGGWEEKEREMARREKQTGKGRQTGSETDREREREKERGMEVSRTQYLVHKVSNNGKKRKANRETKGDSQGERERGEREREKGQRERYGGE